MATPEQQAREKIDEKLQEAGWVVQDMKRFQLNKNLGVAVREFPTSTGPVDYALFVEGVPVGVIEAKSQRRARTSPRWKRSPVDMPTVSLSMFLSHTGFVLLMRLRMN